MSRDASYALLRRRVLDVTGIDIDSYRHQQMERRLRALLDRFKVEDYYTYAKMIERDPEKARELWDFITINVSEFFRNPERWRELREKVVPSLYSGGPLRAWSAGCANGAEPYSLAIVLQEACPGGQYSVLATDIDRKTLERARAGVYEEGDLKNVDWTRMKYFEKMGERYSVSDTVRSRVRFEYHDLLSDEYPSRMDLVVCRNVVIYFTEQAKERVYRGFAAALRPGGVLFLGETETIFNPVSIGLEPVTPFFYRRV
jgi:chemotaxis protein methyltransferase CheR